MLEAVLVGAVGNGSSILYATVGETVSERSGVINLGTEGSMLCGALAAVAVGIATGSPWAGALAGAAAGALLGGVHAFLVLSRRANQIASGLAVTFLGLGLTGLFGQQYVSQQVKGFSDVAIPGLSSIPFLGPILFNHDPLTYLSFAVAPLAWWFLFRTRPGLMVRTSGERAEVLHTFGTSPTLVIFAGWNPLKALAGAYLFSGAVALGFQLQAQGSGISSFLLNMLPYLVVVAVLAVLGRRRLNAGPAELDKVFEAAPAI